MVVIDDGTNELSLTSTPFDGEGVPKKKLTLIQNGVTSSLCYNTYYAMKEGIESTGHCPNKIDRMDGSIFKGPLPMNQIIEPGDTSEENMISDVKEGLLITRMHYVTVIDENKATLSGMTRDGTWFIEDGEIQHPVKNLRFLDSMLRVFSKVDSIGNSLTLEGRLREHSGLLSSITAPAIKLPSMRFTGQTQ
jgi:predicted Zn-dependent protease